MKDLANWKATVLIIRKCHVCGEITESTKEVERCPSCQKSFLPSNYFTKIHAKNSREFSTLFGHGHELNEEDLIKGIFVLW